MTRIPTPTDTDRIATVRAILHTIVRILPLIDLRTTLALHEIQMVDDELAEMLTHLDYVTTGVMIDSIRAYVQTHPRVVPAPVILDPILMPPGAGVAAGGDLTMFSGLVRRTRQTRTPRVYKARSAAWSLTREDLWTLYDLHGDWWGVAQHLGFGASTMDALVRMKNAQLRHRPAREEEPA